MVQSRTSALAKLARHGILKGERVGVLGQEEGESEVGLGPGNKHLAAQGSVAFPH